MKLSKKEYLLLVSQLDEWVRNGDLSEDKYNQLKSSIKTKEINWRRIAQNMLGLAVFFMIVAFLHLIVEEWLIEVISRFFALSEKFFMIFMFVIFVGLVLMAVVIEKKSFKRSTRIFKEAILILALSAFVGFLFFTSNVYNLSAHIDILFVLLTSLVALMFGKIFYSQLLWLLGIFGALLWFGIHTSHIDNQSPLFLGMNLTVRYFALISILLGLYFLLKKIKFPIFFERLTYSTLLSLFMISLWLVALFGNFTSYREWKHASPLVLLPGGVMMLLVSCLFWFVGRRNLISSLKWLGALGILGFAYTQYFLFLWNPLPASLFFFILGLSFFIIGRKAEIIWGR